MPDFCGSCTTSISCLIGCTVEVADKIRVSKISGVKVEVTCSAWEGLLAGAISAIASCGTFVVEVDVVRMGSILFVGIAVTTGSALVGVLRFNSSSYNFFTALR